MSKYGVISGSYFPVFSPNTGKYGPEITPYLDTFHAVLEITNNLNIRNGEHALIVQTHTDKDNSVFWNYFAAFKANFENMNYNYEDAIVE